MYYENNALFQEKVEKEESKCMEKSKFTPEDRKHMDSLSDYLDTRASSAMLVSHGLQVKLSLVTTLLGLMEKLI